MDFKGKKAIYLQIADMICDQILLGELEEEGRVPSVRETAAQRFTTYARRSLSRKPFLR